MLEVGKTYKNGYGYDVRILADDYVVGRSKMHIGLIKRTGDHNSDVNVYEPDGRAGYWGRADPLQNLIVPGQYVNRDKVLEIVAELLPGSSNSTRAAMMGRIQQLEGKELTDA